MVSVLCKIGIIIFEESVVPFCRKGCISFRRASPGFFFSIAELNLQKQYHELDKKNSVFDQMYKLYLKRLVDKDTFKAMTGIEVKAMPKPHRVVVKKDIIQVSKDWKGTPPKGYKMRGSYDKNTKEWTFYMVKDTYLKTLEDNDVSLYDNNHIIKHPGRLYAELNIDGFKEADPATQFKLLQNKDVKDNFVNEFGKEAYWAQQYGSVWKMYSPFSGMKGLDAVDRLIKFAGNAQEYIGKKGEKRFYQDFSGLLDAAFVKLKEAISYDEQGGISLDLVRSIPAAQDIELYYDENSLRDQIHLAKGEAPERMNYPALLGSLRMPSYYEMPTELTNETLIKVLQDWQSFNKPDSWLVKDQMELAEPTQTDLKGKGIAYAKAEAEKAGNEEIGLITDEYAEWLGSYAYQDELLGKNGVKADAATGYEADNGMIYYKWNPVDWVNDSRIFDEDKLTTGKKGVPIIGGADDIATYANAAIENILYKKFWEHEVTDDDYAILESFGMADIIEHLKGLDTVAYEELPANARDAVKRDILKQGNGAYQDFTDEELDYLKTATVSDMDERIAGEAAKDEPDKQMLDALRLYRYYKNDLGITVTGDYEADRTAAKRLFVDRMCELTQSNSLEEVILKMHDMFDGLDEAGYETHYPDELLEARDLWTEAPPELFANTKEETEAAYQSNDAAFVAAVRDSFSQGLSQLQKETEADPAVLKYMALQGHQVGGTEYYRQGRFYNPGLAEESARMRQNNPDAYTFGSIAGGIPSMIATGNLFGGAARALGVTGRTALNAISGAAPMAIQGGLQSVAAGDNVGETIVKTFFWGGTGALSFGAAANKVNAALGTLLKKAPALVQKVVPSLAGAGTAALANAGVNLAAGALSGQEVDIKQALAGMAVDAVFALFLSGRSGGDYLDPQTGKKIEIPEGKTLRSVDPEAARFYEALGGTKVTGEMHNAVGDIYMDYMNIPESVVSRSDFENFRSAYYIYAENPTIKNGAAFLEEASKIYDMPGVTQYTFDPMVTMDAAANARFRGTLDEVQVAREAGMTLQEYLSSKGATNTFTDVEAAVADVYGLGMKKMDGEGDAGYNGAQGGGTNKINTWGSKEDLVIAATIQGKGGVTPVGRAFQKHAGNPSRAGTFVGEISGNAVKNTEQGVKYILQILNNPQSFYTIRTTKTFGEVLDVRLPDGTGARWSADGKTFIMFLEKYTPLI